jgi:hypothetical protein
VDQAATDPTKKKAPADKRSEPARPQGMIIGFGALGLLLVILFFRGNPGTDLAPDQRALAMALVDHMQTQGVLMKYACAENRAYVNKPLWDDFNHDQKRGLTVGLATVCYSEHAGYRVTVLDVETKQQLASFDGKAFTIP